MVANIVDSNTNMAAREDSFSGSDDFEDDYGLETPDKDMFR